MTPTIGRIVLYKMGAGDADAINKRRADFRVYSVNHGRTEAGQPGATGHVGHVGNEVTAGDVYPAVVVRVFDPSVTTANLQVLLDGTDTYWATSRTESPAEGHWMWPERSA
jgi:hypothetical protein